MADNETASGDVPADETAFGGAVLAALGTPAYPFSSSMVGVLGGWLVATCEALGVDDVSYDSCRPGIYREGRKLGSIGLHIHKGVTTHGFSLNVSNSLEGFGAIVVCGHQDLAVTTLARESPSDVTIAQAREVLRDAWATWTASSQR